MILQENMEFSDLFDDGILSHSTPFPTSHLTERSRKHIIGNAGLRHCVISVRDTANKCQNYD